MKKILLILSSIFMLNSMSYAIEFDILRAPALELELNDYKDFFKGSADYSVKIKTLSDYKITCNSDIIGVVYEDKENLKLTDAIDENDYNDLKSIILKTRFETYSYVRLYKYNGEITNLIISANPVFKNDMPIGLGLCKLTPHRGY